MRICVHSFVRTLYGILRIWGSMVKIFINSDRVCDRPLSFERVPNKMIKEHNTTVLNTTSKDACLDACLNEVRDSWEAMQVL